MPSDGYMDAAGIDTPDAGDDTLRRTLADAVEAHTERCSCCPTIEVDEATSLADALLPLIREHVAAAVQDERERIAQNLEARAPSPGDAYHRGEFMSGVRSGLVNAVDIVRSGGFDDE